MNEEKFCKKREEQLTDKIPACPLQCSSSKCKAYQRKPKADFSKKLIVWILGGPGSGKGTQCQKIIAKCKFAHISTGDLLRVEIKKGGDRAKCLESVLERGELVPTDIILALVLEAMEARVNDAIGFLIDGFPREMRQGLEFEKAIGPANLIIYFEVSSETLTSRMMARAETSDRLDDNEATIKCRLKTFFDNNQKVLDQYPGRVKKINAEGSPDQIFKDVMMIIDAIM